MGDYLRLLLDYQAGQCWNTARSYGQLQWGNTGAGPLLLSFLSVGEIDSLCLI